MKLFECPNNSKVVLKSTESGPPASINPKVGEVYTFKHVDGMYSLCYNSQGQPVHLPAWSTVEVIPNEWTMPSM